MKWFLFYIPGAAESMEKSRACLEKAAKCFCLVRAALSESMIFGPG